VCLAPLGLNRVNLMDPKSPLIVFSCPSQTETGKDYPFPKFHSTSDSRHPQSSSVSSTGDWLNPFTQIPSHSSESFHVQSSFSGGFIYGSMITVS